MPKVEYIKNDSDCIIALCPIISEDLSLNYSDFYTQIFKSIKRKKEWQTTHFILENIFHAKTTYSYNNILKPVLIDKSDNISISHSQNYATVITSKNKKVGIDIEEITPRIHKIAHKFLHTSEKEYLENETQKTEMLYLIWCAKEAIYKLSDSFLEFDRDIIIEKFTIFNKSKLNAKVIFQDSFINIELQYIVNDKFVIVWVVES
ncbi:MAG: 4'-phosphopantetheinyl transferase superfamily protein [Bacteroidia bacterium]|nr:4'-phosphopantetheinyl transferase superfamily protein [Bacteroidia bacterium]